MSSFFTPLLHLPLLFLVSPRVGQIQYRIDNARNRIGGMVLHFMFLFHVLFCDLLRLFRCRIQFIENIGRKLFSQHRTVGDNAIGVVDKRYAVNPSYGVDPENSVDTFRFEQLSELVPCVMRAHGVFDRLPQTIERARLFQVVFRHPVILLKGLIADILSDTTRLEWRADAVAVVGQSPRHYLHSFFRRSFRCVPRPRR